MNINLWPEIIPAVATPPHSGAYDMANHVVGLENRMVEEKMWL